MRDPLAAVLYRLAVLTLLALLALPASCATDKATCPCAAAPAAGAVAVRAARVDDVERELVARYNARDLHASHAMRSASFRASFPPENESSWVEGMLVNGKLGESTRIGGDGATHGIYEVKAERGTWRLELHLDPDGTISSLSANRAAPATPPVPRSATTFALPFRGEWLVAWGGSTPATNGAHLGVPSQRRAADLDRVDANGEVRRGDGKRNADYFAFGADILAVADGTVILAVDGVPDNEPGEETTYFTSGNAVILAHEGGLYSMVGHLQLGSVRVRAGAKVKRGAVLGACGNSGSSSQPHLHFQLQDGPRMDTASGVDAVFSAVRVLRDGRASTQDAYVFERGDRISPTR